MFFKSLADLKALQSLNIFYWLPEGGSDPLPFPPLPLLLPTLSSLSIEDTAYFIADFLCKIRTPSVIRPIIAIAEPHRGQPPLDRCMATLKTALNEAARGSHHLSDLSLEYLPARKDYDTSFIVLFSGNADSNVGCDSVELRTWHIPVHDTLRSLNKTFNLSTLASMSFDGYPPIVDPSIEELLAPLPNLAEVTFNQTNFESFLLSNQSGPTRKDREENPQLNRPYFPALKSLVLENLSWRSVVARTSQGATATARLGVLVNRTPLYLVEKITIKNCSHFGYALWNALNGALPGVDIAWDERQNWGDSVGEVLVLDENDSSDSEDSGWGGY